jgi:hypothetical protein
MLVKERDSAVKWARWTRSGESAVFRSVAPHGIRTLTPGVCDVTETLSARGAQGPGEVPNVRCSTRFLDGSR